KTVDYAELRKLSLQEQETIDTEQLVTFFSNLLDSTVLLPNQEIQRNIFLSYALAPSALLDIAPILFITGREGTGKTLLSRLIALLNTGDDPLSAGSTFASTRDWLNKHRWNYWSDDEYEGERNTCLVFDNVGTSTFSNNEQLYLMFLNGYSRRSDTMLISKGRGEIMVSRVFCKKVISTIFNLLALPEFTELKRRCIVLKTLSLDEFSDTLTDDFMETQQDLDALNLSNLVNAYQDFWNGSRSLKFIKAKKHLLEDKASYVKRHKLSSARFTLSYELIATGKVIGLWDDLDEGCEVFARYWSWQDSELSEKSALELVLDRFLNSEILAFKLKGLPVEINPKTLKNAIGEAVLSGEIENNPKPGQISEFMRCKGYKLEKGSDKKLKWIK
ncbi:MAG TPA: hypothetical protein VLS94_12540, partial [Fusibacter sp.]|nr:hypothetical protein [Fusibacter sp.]